MMQQHRVALENGRSAHPIPEKNRFSRCSTCELSERIITEINHDS
jgi:hypothetical protein